MPGRSDNRYRRRSLETIRHFQKAYKDLLICLCNQRLHMTIASVAGGAGRVQESDVPIVPTKGVQRKQKNGAPHMQNTVVVVARIGESVSA